MSMLSSSLLSLAPALGPVRISLAALQLRKQPVVASPVVLPWASCGKESRSRAASLACYAHDNKKPYDIQPIALVHTRQFGGGPQDKWRITEDKEHVTVKLDVGELMASKEGHLEVTAVGRGLLTIEYKDDTKGEGKEDSEKEENPNPARELDVRLMMPDGYDATTAKASILPNGRWLEVTIAKPTVVPKQIPIS